MSAPTLTYAVHFDGALLAPPEAYIHDAPEDALRQATELKLGNEDALVSVVLWLGDASDG